MPQRQLGRSLQGIAARMLGAVLLPLMAVVALTYSGISDLRQSQDLAERLDENTTDLVSLVELQVGLLSERASCATAEELAADPALADSVAQVRAVVDDSMAAIDPDRRPIETDDITRLRQLDDFDGVSCSVSSRMYDDHASTVQKAIGESADDAQSLGIEIGDPEVNGLIDVLVASVQMTTTMQILELQLEDYYNATSIDQPILRSGIAITDNEFDVARLVVERRGRTSVVEQWTATRPLLEFQQRRISEALGGNRVAPTTGTDSTAAGLDAVAELPKLAAFEVVDRTGELTAQARWDLRRGVRIALITLFVSLIAAAAFSRSILRPTTRLTEHARSVGQGDLDIDPLPLTGPPEIIDASQAINDLVSNLQLVRSKSEALAALDLEADVLRQPLPGALGESLHQSIMVLSESVEARHQLQSQLAHEASHDMLTGIPNRSAAIAFLEHAIANASGPKGMVAAIFVDLDGFKRINDTHGHAVGDESLLTVAERIHGTVRSGDLAARLGGDEFLIVSTGVAQARDALGLARRAVLAVAEPVIVGDLELQLNACAGIALWPSTSVEDDDPLVLLQQADVAVYDAKSQGPGTIAIYDDRMHQRQMARKDTETALTRALVSDDELRLEYQPIVDASTGEIACVEALIRWDRPGVGPVRPDEFIPIAERSSLILDIDRWVISTALIEASTWAGLPGLEHAAISVNVSGLHLIGQDLVPDITRGLEISGLDPSRVVVEITETVLVNDIVGAEQCLSALRELGVGVAVDDFGTGFTSLTQLRSLPLDRIKIDRSLIQDLTGTDDNSELIRMVNEIARHLGALTVAEGIETADQRIMLEALGCDLLQGYYFAKPMRPEALTAFAKSQAGHHDATTVIPATDAD